MRQTIMAEHNDGLNRFRLGIIVECEEGTDVIAAIRDASEEFCRTEAGQAVVAGNNGDFNYGDFVNEVPEEICKNHGFYVVDTFVTDLVVKHDERLLPDDA